MPATINLTLGNLNAGRQVKYSVANSRTPAENFAQADADGDVSFDANNASSVVFLVTLPDGQYFHLPVQQSDTTIDLGTIPIYPQGVPPGLEDITALILTTVLGGGITNSAPAGGVPVTLDVDGNLGAYFLSYATLLSQGAVSAPIAEDISNPFSGSMVWTRNSAGDYTLTNNDEPFAPAKTLCIFSLCGSTSAVSWQFYCPSTVYCTLKTFDAAGAPADINTSEGHCSVEVRVYS